MPPPLLWTEHADSLIRRLRLASATWDEVAAALRVSRWSAIARGRRIGALAPERLASTDAEADPAREPLAAGHWLAWDVLTAGTLLAGTDYPWPPLSPGLAARCCQPAHQHAPPALMHLVQGHQE
jgi:hypothetical protein